MANITEAEIRRIVENIIKGNAGASAAAWTSTEYNGRKLIGDKCQWAKDNGFGGVMIWAYETDLPLKHHASLGRAMYKVLRQTPNK